MKIIATMDFIYDGKTYHITDEFSSDHTEEGVEFIFTDGNYACDCNRSVFIRTQCDPTFPDMDCGDEIKMENFRIVRKEGSGD